MQNFENCEFHAGDFFKATDSCSYGITNKANKFIAVALMDCTAKEDGRHLSLMAAVSFTHADDDFVVNTYDIRQFVNFKPSVEEISEYMSFVESDRYNRYPAYRDKMINLLNAYIASQTKTEIVEEVKEEKKTYNFDIDAYPTEKEINEMISAVDQKRFMKLLAIAGTSGSNKRMAEKRVCDQYLRRWAIAKFPFYKLFGNQLLIFRDIDFTMDSKEMKSALVPFRQEHQKYYTLIREFNPSEYINNTADSCHADLVENCSKYYSNGMKLTKFFANVIDDKKFHDDLAMLLTSTKLKGKAVVSIDPYDILTCSLNQHEWTSCHNIVDGCYATGPLSYLCDPSTMIAYKENCKTYSYNEYGFKFEGNSKSWRQMVYFDKHTCSAIFSRQYADPTAMDEMSTVCRDLLEEQISTYLDVPNNWMKSKNKYYGDFQDDYNGHYSDIDNFHNLRFVYYFIKNKFLSEDANISFHVGSPVYCVYCGDELDDNGEIVSCRDCNGDCDCDDDEDDDGEHDYIDLDDDGGDED